MKFYLEKKSTLKGRVEIRGQIGRCNEYSFQVFNLLKDNVLHSIVHLIYRMRDVFCTLVDDTICFVEEQDWHDIRVLA